MIRGVEAFVRRIRGDQRGATIVVAALSMTALFGFAAITVDVGYLYHFKRLLQASSDFAALAGATKLSSGASQATGAANTYSAGSGGKNAIPNLSVTANPQALNCSGGSGTTCTVTATNPNAIKVTQTANVPLFFARALGFTSMPISTTAYALAAGGKGLATDIMIILDTTASMNSSDSSCSGNTRLNCAFNGFRALLQGFTPATQQVGLMIFPGLDTAAHAALEYDCSSSPMSSAIAKYNASSSPPTTTPPVYLIVGLSSDYKIGSSLNTSSNLVIAARGGATGCTAGVVAYGGVGTFYADAVTAAQNYLTNNGRAGANKMIILLSDGDANASATNIQTSKKNNQCHEAITASANAQEAGTTVVTIGYGSPSTGCSTDTGANVIGPCATLLKMASIGTGTSSAPQWFYSDTTSGCSGGHAATNLNSIFTQVGAGINFGGARLIPAS